MMIIIINIVVSRFFGLETLDGVIQEGTGGGWEAKEEKVHGCGTIVRVGVKHPSF